MSVNSETWARSHGIPIEDLIRADVGAGSNEDDRTAPEIAARALCVQAVIAVACECDAEPIIEWLRQEHLWDAATAKEQAFLNNPAAATDLVRATFQGQMEAEWVLLWALGKVEVLGLPTRRCDSRRMVDELIPPLGGSTRAFIDEARLRAPEERLAESDRYYNLWCAYLRSKREGSVPADLLTYALYQREYAFEWLLGVQAWDDVRCDA